jgi:acyl-coenzyme A thioesterase PaaI-like protein
MPAETLLARVLAEAEAGTYLSRLGFHLKRAENGEADVEFHNTKVCANRAGALHGGAIASVILAAAELAAASSERGARNAELRLASLSVSFLDTIGTEASLCGTARVLRRGRDVVHVGGEACALDGANAARALLVYRLVDGHELAVPRVRSRAAAAVLRPRERPSASPYMTGLEAVLLEGTTDWSCMAAPELPNAARVGRVHDGAVVGLLDTCAAAAAFESCGEHHGGPSATVSLSMSVACASSGEIRAGARVVGRTGTSFACEAEAWDTSGMTAATALIGYRIAGAKD